MNDRPEHLWDQLAPSTEKGQHRSRMEGEESLTEMSQEDLANNANILDPSSNSGVQVRYERAAKADEIPPDEYRTMMR